MTFRIQNLPTWFLFTLLVTLWCRLGETTIIACKCSDTSDYMDQSKQFSTVRVCVYHTNTDAIIVGLRDMTMAATRDDNNTVFTTLDDATTFTVECSRNHCAVTVTMTNDQYVDFMDAWDSSPSLELTGNVTLQEHLIDTPTNQWTNHEIPVTIAVKHDDDWCPYIKPKTGTFSVKGAVWVLIALIVVVILCCYGTQFRNATTLGIPL